MTSQLFDRWDFTMEELKIRQNAVRRCTPGTSSLSTASIYATGNVFADPGPCSLIEALQQYTTAHSDHQRAHDDLTTALNSIVAREKQAARRSVLDSWEDVSVNSSHSQFPSRHGSILEHRQAAYHSLHSGSPHSYASSIALPNGPFTNPRQAPLPPAPTIPMRHPDHAVSARERYLPSIQAGEDAGSALHSAHWQAATTTQPSQLSEGVLARDGYGRPVTLRPGDPYVPPDAARNIRAFIDHENVEIAKQEARDREREARLDPIDRLKVNMKAKMKIGVGKPKTK